MRSLSRAFAKTSIDVGMLRRVIVTEPTGGFVNGRQDWHHMAPMARQPPSDSDDAPIDDAAIVEVREEETVNGVPVLAEVRPLEPAAPTVLPAVQAAAVAATGFVAGAATLALVRRHSARKLDRRRMLAQRRRGTEALPILATRSFLVDVHLIAKPGE